MNTPSDSSSASRNTAANEQAQKAAEASGQSVSADGDGSFTQSGALSAGSFRRGEVDPRTGSFNYRIPIARLTGNRQMGPSIDLVLSYNHFSKERSEFGQGWSLNLSRFIDGGPRKQVLLRDGRIIDLKWNSDTSAYEPETVGVIDFKLKKLDDPPDGYQIAYKDGVVETLTPIANRQKSVCVTKITGENGYSLSVSYRASETYPDIDLQTISDELGSNLIKLDPLSIDPQTGIGFVETLYDNNDSTKSTMTFFSSNTLVPGWRVLEKCQVGIDPPVDTIKLGYELQGQTDIPNSGFLLISSVTSNFGGPATETITYSNDMTAPEGAPWPSLPAVKTYQLEIFSAGTGITRNEKREYSYGDGTASNNFLGYNGVTTWDENAIDNIYNCPAGYTYQSKETVTYDGGDPPSFSVTRTYDVYHRLITEDKTLAPSSPVTYLQVVKSYEYPGSTSTAYASLPLQYQLATSISINYTEKQLDPVDPDNNPQIENTRSTSQTSVYDEYGNMLSQAETGGMAVDYNYYPAGGTEGECPAEKNGFTRYAQSIARHLVNDSDNRISITYLYGTTQNKDDCSYVVLIGDKEERKLSGVWSNESRETKYTFYGGEADEGDNRGRLKADTLYLSGVSGIVTTYSYAFSADRSELTTTTEVKGVDGNVLTKSATVSTVTGWLLKTVDNLQVVTDIAYDNIGRLISVTRAPGTEYESATTYSYAIDASTYVQTRTENTPSMDAITLTYDAFGNVVKREIGGIVSHMAEFDTRGLLAKEVVHDEGVPQTDGSEVSLDLTDVYEYDGFGNLATASYHDETAIDRHFNIGTAVLTECRRATSGDAAAFKFDCTETRHEPVTMLPLYVSEYGSDGVTLKTKTWYMYDALCRLRIVNVANAIGDEEETERFEYDFFDRIQTCIQQQQTADERTTTYTYWAYGVEPNTTSIAVNGIVVAKQSYDDLGRLDTIDRNPDRADDEKLLTHYYYESGYSVPDTVFTPRNLYIDCSYFPELGCVHKKIAPKENGVITEYAYDKDKVKLISETCTSGTNVVTRTIGYDGKALIASETLTASAGQSYTNEFTRTSGGALKSITVTAGSYPSKKVEYFYDQCGRVSRLSFSRGSEKDLDLDLTYYFGVLPATATYDFKRADDQKFRYVNSFGYDYRLRVLSRSYAFGEGDSPEYAQFSSSSVAYDDFGRIVEQLVSASSAATPDADRVTKFVHVFDKLGRLIASTVDEELTTVYPKDSNGNDVKQFEFNYDQYDNVLGSRTTAKDASVGTATTYTHDGKNKFEMTHASTGSTDVAFTYDESGNMSTMVWTDGSRPNVTLLYDSYEKLTQVTTQAPDVPAAPARTVTLDYGANGKLQKESLSETQAEQTTAQQVSALGYCDGVFDTSWRKQTPDATDAQIASYVGLGVGPDAISVVQGVADNYTKTRSLLLRDVSGSVYGEADPAAAAAPDITQLVYSPYGYLGDAMAQSSHDPVRFKGARFDPLTNLYHVGDGNRSYDPLLMRFLQYDTASPFGEGGLNPYVYCGGDPVTYFDPSGNDRTSAIVLGVVGILFGLIGFGFGIFAALAAASSIVAGVVAGVMIVAGVSGMAGGACGIAAATVEDEETSRQLQTAAFALDMISLVLGLGLPAVVGMHRATKYLVAKASAARVLKANTTFTRIEKTGFAVSPPVRIEGIPEPVHLVKAHGNKGILTKPTLITKDTADQVRRAATSGEYYYLEKLRTDKFSEFTEFTDDLLRRTYPKSDPNGGVMLLSCEGSWAGHITNAQEVAKLWARPTYSLPGPTVFTSFKKAATGTGSTMTAYGAPWFPKVRGPY